MKITFSTKNQSTKKNCTVVFNFKSAVREKNTFKIMDRNKTALLSTYPFRLATHIFQK